ncbi:MAG TPA: crosslink repair DNA glycosylase YcaQ family protein [Solirubrobacteraceae bacterium]
MTAPTLSIALARRLALHAQGLALPIGRRRAGGRDVANVVARIGALQLDPVAPVARSPLLVAHARLGLVEDEDIEDAAYTRRFLFDAWAHEASLVHVDDIWLHRHVQQRRARGEMNDAWRAFLKTNRAFAGDVVAALRERGPLRASEIEHDSVVEHWQHGYWTAEVSPRQTTARMLQVLWRTGVVGIAARRGQERLWDLFERCLPEGMLDAVPDLSVDAFEEAAARRALRALGVAKPGHVRNHFLRGWIRDPQAVLERMPDVVEVRVEGLGGRWFVHADDLERAPQLEPGRRTVALSPFDNLICDRKRTAELFGLDHKLEIYVPASKRVWGYYVLPILHRERFVARADLKLDGDRLHVLSLHHEDGLPAQRAVQTALERLAAWRGAVL